MSLVQLLMQCWVLSDWSQIAGNPVKFGLGFVSLSFDIIFMVQHFACYPAADHEEANSAGEEVDLLASHSAVEPVESVDET